jgi:hypothetical protein
MRRCAGRSSSARTCRERTFVTPTWRRRGYWRAPAGAWLGDADWKGTGLSRAELKGRERQATTIWPEGWRGELPE